MLPLGEFPPKFNSVRLIVQGRSSGSSPLRCCFSAFPLFPPWVCRIHLQLLLFIVALVRFTSHRSSPGSILPSCFSQALNLASSWPLPSPEVESGARAGTASAAPHAVTCFPAVAFTRPRLRRWAFIFPVNLAVGPNCLSAVHPAYC